MISRLDIVSRLQEFLDRSQIDMSRATLGVWIALINVAIVVLVVGGISISAIGSLRNLADQQGQSRVQLAGAMAREDLRRFMEDALTEARSIAERQTFHRLLAERNPATLDPFLRPFVHLGRHCGVRRARRYDVDRAGRRRAALDGHRDGRNRAGRALHGG
jgi:hypothetical protein